MSEFTVGKDKSFPKDKEGGNLENACNSQDHIGEKYKEENAC